MAGGIPLSTALQLLDGTPHRKVGTFFAERLPLAKVLAGGNVGGLMQRALQDGNLSGILQNPVGPLLDRLGAVTGGAAGAGGLGGALGALRAAGDNLIGLTNGGAGFFDLLGHASLVGMLGEHVPPELALDRVLGPVTAGPLLERIAAGGAVLNAEGGVASQIQGIVAASADALARGKAVQPMISAVATISGAIAAPDYTAAGDPLQAVLATFVRPEARQAMAGALSAYTAPNNHARIDVAALTSLEG